MRPPCEIVQREFLPSLRGTLARLLSERGLSQVEIAERLDLTQAAVSKYMRQHEGKRRIDTEAQSLAERLVDQLVNESHSKSKILKEVCSTCMSLRVGSEICLMHKRSYPFLEEEDCSICSELIGGSDVELSARSMVILDIQRALHVIQDSKGFSLLVPEVRANLVACPKDAKGIQDVAGVPGRITLVDGKARAFVAPQFGASRHTASLLLQVKKRWSRYRACLCLSGKDIVIDVARNEGVRIISLDTSVSEVDEIAKQVFKTRTSSPKGTLGINVPGGVGVEPILYIFGKSAYELGQLAQKMSSRLQ